MADKELMNINGEPTRLQRADDTAFPGFRDTNEWMNNWNRWFEGLTRNFLNTPANALSSWPDFRLPDARCGTFVPAVNISENENEFLVTAELPGLNEKDVEITLSKELLTIKGEKKQESEEKGTGWHRIERTYGSFHRTIQLPQEVDAEKIEAGFKQGVLTVHLPKLPEVKAGVKKIQVKTEETQTDKSR